LNRALATLPVFPAAAQKALQLLSTETWNASDVQAIAASDQVLASSLIRVANSCSYGARKIITTLNHAIAYLGAQHASGVLIAASVKRLFAPPRLRRIWNHSIDASEVSRNLAKLSRHANPEEAFLAGLVHDIGRLAMALLPERFQARWRIWLSKAASCRWWSECCAELHTRNWRERFRAMEVPSTPGRSCKISPQA
jgi:HD-like signal output (HDOD) protein